MHMSSVLQRHEPEQGGWHSRVRAVAEGTPAPWGGRCASPTQMTHVTTKGREAAVDETTSKFQDDYG